MNVLRIRIVTRFAKGTSGSSQYRVYSLKDASASTTRKHDETHHLTGALASLTEVASELAGADKGGLPVQELGGVLLKVCNLVVKTAHAGRLERLRRSRHVVLGRGLTSRHCVVGDLGIICVWPPDVVWRVNHEDRGDVCRLSAA